MIDRRTQILDAALHVLASQGMRGLTHRAADTAAGIPVGSTSYYFRSRAALVSGCLDRLLEIDLDTEVPMVEAPESLSVLIEIVSRIGVEMATIQRTRTLARLELTLVAVRDGQLHDGLARGRSTIRARGAETLQALGATAADAAMDHMLAVLDGLVLTAAAYGPYEPLELAEWMRPPIEAVLRAQPGLDQEQESPGGG